MFSFPHTELYPMFLPSGHHFKALNLQHQLANQSALGVGITGCLTIQYNHDILPLITISCYCDSAILNISQDNTHSSLGYFSGRCHLEMAPIPFSSLHNSWDSTWYG